MAELTLDELAASVGEVIGTTAKEVEDEFKARHAALEARLARLEARSELRYRGVWRAGQTYPASSMISHAGSLWISEETTAEKPGAGRTSWTLAVKRGRA
jgi:hypothetical protein